MSDIEVARALSGLDLAEVRTYLAKAERAKGAAKKREGAAKKREGAAKKREGAAAVNPEAARRGAQDREGGRPGYICENGYVVRQGDTVIAGAPNAKTGNEFWLDAGFDSEGNPITKINATAAARCVVEAWDMLQDQNGAIWVRQDGMEHHELGTKKGRMQHCIARVRGMMKDDDGDALTNAQASLVASEVLSELLKDRTVKDGDWDNDLNGRLYVFRNGVFDLKTGKRAAPELLKGRGKWPRRLFRSVQDYDLDLQADMSCPKLKALYVEIFDSETAWTDAIHIMGTCQLKNKEGRRHAFFLYGREGKEGKGLYLKHVRQIVGKSNYAAPSVESFSDRASRAAFIRKRVLGIDEVPESGESFAKLVRSTNFKRSTGSGMDFSRGNYQDGDTDEYNTTVLININRLFGLDGSEIRPAELSRICIVPCHGRLNMKGLRTRLRDLGLDPETELDMDADADGEPNGDPAEWAGLRRAVWEESVRQYADPDGPEGAPIGMNYEEAVDREDGDGVTVEEFLKNMAAQYEHGYRITAEEFYKIYEDWVNDTNKAFVPHAKDRFLRILGFKGWATRRLDIMNLAGNRERKHVYCVQIHNLKYLPERCKKYGPRDGDYSYDIDSELNTPSRGSDGGDNDAAAAERSVGAERGGDAGDESDGAEMYEQDMAERERAKLDGREYEARGSDRAAAARPAGAPGASGDGAAAGTGPPAKYGVIPEGTTTGDAADG